MARVGGRSRSARRKALRDSPTARRRRLVRGRRAHRRDASAGRGGSSRDGRVRLPHHGADAHHRVRAGALRDLHPLLDVVASTSRRRRTGRRRHQLRRHSRMVDRTDRRRWRAHADGHRLALHGRHVQHRRGVSAGADLPRSARRSRVAAVGPRRQCAGHLR